MLIKSNYSTATDVRNSDIIMCRNMVVKGASSYIQPLISWWSRLSEMYFIKNGRLEFFASDLVGLV
jgi:hypothetical protein